MADIECVWPDASLVGHAKGHWRAKHQVTARHRAWAYAATLASKVGPLKPVGDIRVIATFYPPHRRGDRVSYPSLLKPVWDGIADALGVNDRRFLPTFQYAEPVKDGRVVISIIEE